MKNRDYYEVIESVIEEKLSHLPEEKKEHYKYVLKHLLEAERLIEFSDDRSRIKEILKEMI